MPNEKRKMTVTFDVDEAQAVALKIFFDQWRRLGGMGASRWCAFYVDGDGPFQPRCKIESEWPLPEISDEMLNRALIKREFLNEEMALDGFFYDFDGLYDLTN